MDQCRILLDDLSDTAKVQDVTKFLARFTSYANQLSAVRQYLQNSLLKNLGSTVPHPEQFWMQNLESDVDFSAIMSLRHVDQHKESIRIDRQAIDLSATVFLHTRASGGYVVHDENGNIKSQGAFDSADEEPLSPARQPSQEKNVTYFCDALAIADFMIVPKAYTRPAKFGRIANQRQTLAPGTDLPMKAQVVAYVAVTDLSTIADRCHSKLALEIANAKSQGFF